MGQVFLMGSYKNNINLRPLRILKLHDITFKREERRYDWYSME